MMRDFATLFRGREDAHGEYSSLAGREPTDRGKLVSRGTVSHTPLTSDLLKKHLSGKHRMGVIPVMSNGFVWWFCLDVDFYKIGNKTLAEVGGYEKITKAISSLGLPLLVTRSKSGGAHIWCFLEEAVKAEEAHRIAEDYARRLNLADILGVDQDEFKRHLDIFPKDYSPTDTGCWVNLPYFGDACHCVGLQGTQNLTLPEFVELAADHLLHPDDIKFQKGKKDKAKGTGSDRPPCIDFMIENGVEEGSRDNCVTHFGVYAKKAFPDDWDEKVREFNEDHVNPPLRDDEINKILKSLKNKDFQYLCKKVEQIYCDKATCKKRTFGIGKEAVGDIGIEHIEKIDGESPIYLVTLDGKTFDCKLDQLYSYSMFRKRAMGSLNRLIPNMKQPEWEDLLVDYLEMMEVTEAAADTQMRDRVVSAFQNWCSQCCVTDDFDAAMEANSPFYNGKTIVFSGDALLSQLDRQLRIPRDEAYIYMRGWGTMINDYTVKGETRKLWVWKQNGPLWFDPYKGKRK